MGLKLISGPATYAVTLAQAKAHLNIDFADQDDEIQTYLDAAIGYLDGPNGYLKQALVDQTYDLYLDAFPTDEIKIPLGPLIEVSSVNYIDGDEVEQTISDTNYTVDTASDFDWILPDYGYDWPTPHDAANVVRIRFRSGFVNNGSSPVSGSVPAPIRAAILMLTGTMYQNREGFLVGVSADKMPWGVDQLLQPYRKHLNFA